MQEQVKGFSSKHTAAPGRSRKQAETCIHLRERETGPVVPEGGARAAQMQLPPSLFSLGGRHQEQL